MLSTAAFNALLKTLEEPPSHAMFILATTELQKIPATVLSRCQHHEFRRFPIHEIVGYLTRISEAEHFQYEPEALTLIARQSTGAMRDAVTILDQISSTGEPITLKSAQSILGTAANQSVIRLLDTILDRNPKAGIEIVHKVLDNGTDPRQFGRQTVEYLRLLLMTKLGSLEKGDVVEETQVSLNQQAARLTTERILELIKIFNDAEQNSRSAWFPGLSLEYAIADASTEQIHPVAVRPEPQKRIREKQPERQIAASMEEIQDAENVDDMLETKQKGTNQVYIRKGQKPDPSVTKEEIEKVWEQVRKLIKQHDAILAAELKPVKLIEVKDGILVLGFPRESQKKQMESRRKNMIWTSAAITNILGKSVGVTFVYLKERNTIDQSTGPVVDTAIQLGGKLANYKENRKK